MLTAHAAKSLPQPVDFVQPDGTVITVIPCGDEHFNWYVTTDNVVVVASGNAFYVATVSEEGELAASSLLIHNANERHADEQAFIESQDKTAISKCIGMKRANANRRNEPLGDHDPAYFSHYGKPNILVVLAEFADNHFTVDDPIKTFTQYFNAEYSHEDYGHREDLNFGSVKQYFKDISNGTFEPQFHVVGPVKLSNNMSYYGGSNPSSPNDEKRAQLAADAGKAAKDMGLVDVSDPMFDNDGDGRLDLVIVIYAGYGQNTGGEASTVWAAGGSTSLTIDDVQMQWYCVSCELFRNENYWSSRGLQPQVNGVGVICHEFSHDMGLPDFYPTTSSAYADNQEMEYWDVMDGGLYVGNGYSPTPYSAWESEVMGWGSIETLEHATGNLQLTNVFEGGKAYRFLNDEDAREYIVLENRQNTGWNAKQLGHGLLVYHVKYPQTEVNLSDRPNNILGEPGMAVIPADKCLASSYLIGKETSWGTGEKKNEDGEVISTHIATSYDYQMSHFGDSFPGSNGIDALTFDGDFPNFKWRSGEAKINKSLTNIVEDETTGIVTLDFNVEGEDAINMPEQQAGAAHSGTFTIDGRRITLGKQQLKKGVYIVDGRKMVVR